MTAPAAVLLLASHAVRIGPSAPARQSVDAACLLCERRLRGEDVALAAVPSLLHRSFEDDFRAMSNRSARMVLANVTCIRPASKWKFSADDRIYDEALVRHQASCSRQGFRDARCKTACSRVAVSQFATAAECLRLRQRANALMAAGYGDGGCRGECSIGLAAMARAGDVRASVLLLQLIERMRRALSCEYGVPLCSLRVSSCFISKFTADADHTSYGKLHADEGSVDRSHFSAVLHLQSQGSGFEGGELVFSDPLPGSHGSRELTRLTPVQGRLHMFSSGWENLHYVDRITSGVRFALPVFFEHTPDYDVEQRAISDGYAADDGIHLARQLCTLWGA